METFYRVEQVAKKLQIHWQTVLRLIKSGKLIAMKLGRGYRIDPKDLDDFINRSKQKMI